MRRDGAGSAEMVMTMRTRKLVGTILLMLFLASYALVAALVAVVLQVRNASGLVELLFYVVAGLAWVIPAGLLIRWMHRPGRPADRS
jgi:hypothetical protein